nr:hypothetical protein [Streptomyces sp. MMS21 TC-5]
MTMQPPTHVQMPMPAFEEYEPAGDCVCRGCAQRRRALARARAIPLRDGGTPPRAGRDGRWSSPPPPAWSSAVAAPRRSP